MATQPKHQFTGQWKPVDEGGEHRDGGGQEADAKRLQVFGGRGGFVDPLFKTKLDQIHDPDQVRPIQRLTPDGSFFDTET